MDRRARVQAGVEFGRQDGARGSRGGRGTHHHPPDGIRSGGHDRSNNGGGYSYSTNALPKDCATSNYKRMIHDPGTWRFLQDTYIDTVFESKRSQRYAKRKQNPNVPISGFDTVDVIVKDDGYRGRSVYAAQHIRKGTRVWQSTHLVSFETPFELQAFLGMLDHDLQCDALLWAYVEKGEGYVSLALDEGSFVNHGENEDVINIDKDCFALRDIRPGEELLENYTEFIGFQEIEWFDEIRGRAWIEEEATTSKGSKSAAITDDISSSSSSSSILARSTDGYNKFGAPKLWASKADTDAPLLVPAAVVAMAILIVGVAAAYAIKQLFPNHMRNKEKDGI